MWGRRTAALLLLALAFVVWNVVFDRRVAVEGARFTRESVERYQSGEALVTIDAGFRPRVRRAALEATLWGGAVLAAGLIALARSTKAPGAAPEGTSAR